jgi:hypothetical protein
MDRITDKHLKAVVDRINTLTGSPMKPYAASGPMRAGSGHQMVAQIGNYHLDGAYGGVSLCRTVNENGGVSDIFNVGHVSKRQLYELMQAYIRGFEAGRGA